MQLFSLVAGSLELVLYCFKLVIWMFACIETGKFFSFMVLKHSALLSG